MMNPETHANASFEYAYSAKEQQEVERIRKKYAPAGETQDKMALLRSLDRQTTRKGMAVSLTVGVFSTLVMGTGMSCVMVWADTMFVPGVLIGLVGIAGIIAVYPLYVRIVERERARLAPQVLALVEELKGK